MIHPRKLLGAKVKVLHRPPMAQNIIEFPTSLKAKAILAVEAEFDEIEKMAAYTTPPTARGIRDRIMAVLQKVL
jgi:hypothetical protein